MIKTNADIVVHKLLKPHKSRERKEKTNLTKVSNAGVKDANCRILGGVRSPLSWSELQQQYKHLLLAAGFDYFTKAHNNFHRI